VYIDLLFASSGIEPEIVAAAEELAVLEDVAVRVASRAHLIAMKVLARDDRHRPQDVDDLRALVTEASDDELNKVREALALIEARRYNRGRNLSEDFTQRGLHAGYQRYGSLIRALVLLAEGVVEKRAPADSNH
jgi:hypothetical protein